jgi:hypothetical protein
MEVDEGENDMLNMKVGDGQNEGRWRSKQK